MMSDSNDYIWNQNEPEPAMPTTSTSSMEANSNCR